MCCNAWEHAVSEGDGREQCHCQAHQVIDRRLGWLVRWEP
jgi:hypothetical protein